MTYAIIEMQGYASELAMPDPVIEADDTAYTAFYQKCAAAAASEVPIHTVMLVTREGNVLKKEVFTHEPKGSTTNEEGITEPSAFL